MIDNYIDCNVSLATDGDIAIRTKYGYDFLEIDVINGNLIIYLYDEDRGNRYHYRLPQLETNKLLELIQSKELFHKNNFWRT